MAGDYDGMLEPDVHYLPVRADFADADAVVERLGDHALLERLAERAHRDLVLSGRYGYAALAARIEAVLDEERPLTAGAANGAAIRRAQLAASAYSTLVVRPPRWAYVGGRSRRPGRRRRASSTRAWRAGGSAEGERVVQVALSRRAARPRDGLSCARLRYVARLCGPTAKPRTGTNSHGSTLTG